MNFLINITSLLLFIYLVFCFLLPAISIAE